MSMFHELMMRKKEEIMYVTIKGTLTENDGVFSGFSASNYLEIPNVPTYTQDDRYEVVFKFNLTSFSDSTLCGSSGAFVVPVINNSGKIQYFSSITGFTGHTGTNTLVVGQNYWFKAIYENSSFNSYISTDGINWVLDYSKSVSATFSKSGALQIGRNTNVSTQYLKGSMNLNNSYIKINSTKYKLQAVVGYTIVGSPTIVDGVVSGFSSANYLLLGANVPYSNNFEMLFKFTTGTIGTTQAIFDGTTSNNGATILISSNGKLFVSAGNGSWIVNTSGTTVLSANTTYYAQFSYKNGVYKLELSTDNVSWNTEISVESSSTLVSTSAKSIGYSTRFSGRVFSGSIDMNETYIKINNKLWFNGQQA